MTRVEQLEKQLADNKAIISFNAKCEKLLKDPLFREIVLEEFAGKEVVRNMELAGDLRTPAEQRNACLQAAYAGGEVKRYFHARAAMAKQAAADLEAIEDELTFARENPEVEAGE